MIKVDGEDARAAAAEIVSRGGVIAFRTDTFYGLGVDPLNTDAVGRVKELKGRGDNKPILILVSEIDQVDRFVKQPKAFKAIGQAYWPAALTLVGAARPELPVGLTAGTNTIGIRLPDNENVRKLVRACGGALTATSANVSGMEPARTAQDVVRYFPEGIDLIIDGGQVTVTQPSTVVDVTSDSPKMVREGAVSRQALKELMGKG